MHSVVVGAGAIGLATAYSLRKRGREVTVFDRGDPGAACSLGNAGWVVPSLSAPLPAPGLTWTSLKWMFRADSPLYISPIAAPGLARWLFRFWRHCNRRDYEAGLQATAALNGKTLALFDALEQDGVHCELHRRGILFVFLDEQYVEQSLAEFAYLEQLGYARPMPFGSREMLAHEPGLSDQVRGGFLVEHEYHVRPESLTGGYSRRLGELGVEIRAGVSVDGGIGSGGNWQGIRTSAGDIKADEIVLAAGAWTGLVGERFGVSLPVQAGKGYSITVKGNGGAMTRPLYLGEAKIGCSPFDGAARYAGTMELSGINTTLDPRRARGLRSGLARYLRAPPREGEGQEWVGMRPLTPDGVPMLGRAPGQKNLFVATGHAMLGITLAPATGEAMAGLMTGEVPEDALRAFEPGRFNW